MAIDSSIPNTEIIITTGQVEVTCQDLLNYIRTLEESFQMMSNNHIADASGKAPLGGGVFTEIVLTLLQGIEGAWTIRFEDEASAHTKITGGTFLATDTNGDPRPPTTNYALTINQAVSGSIVETAASGLTPSESTQLDNIHDEVRSIEGGAHLSDMMRCFMAALAGESNGAVIGQAGTMHFRNMGDTKDRITVSYDEHGNRTSISLDMT